MTPLYSNHVLVVFGTNIFGCKLLINTFCIIITLVVALLI